MVATGDRGGTARAADALAALFQGPLGTGLAPAAKAARAWYASNGDRERRHTTGVWLRKPGRMGADPVMVVALDSNLLAAELGTNKDLYLSRLSFHGVAISDIRFTVGKAARSAASRDEVDSRDRTIPRDLADGRGSRASRGELPGLSEEERSHVAEVTRNLPDGLRQSVSRAMCASLRRSKVITTQDT